LEIIYTDDNNNTLNLICTPVETFFIKKKFYIKVIGYNGSRIYEIPVENIKSINQLPTSGNSAVMPTTIVFRIKNRLAKNYKMRPWESLEKIEENGNLIIINKNEDLQFLLKRLMRYGVECEIISPKFFKEEMINQINKTLSNYQ
jgi:predicted DNA-binding transcriptional regulator YafY